MSTIMQEVLEYLFEIVMFKYAYTENIFNSTNI